MNKTERKNLLKAADLLKILSHPVRLAILCDLMHNGEMSAGEIFKAQEKSAGASQVSQYLAEFRRRKYVRSRKAGQNVFYSFSSPLIESVISPLYQEFCKKK
ncbi:MAG: metalloregulator ArsR/SmtB family transcription factor [Micavibrio sp.]